MPPTSWLSGSWLSWAAVLACAGCTIKSLDLEGKACPCPSGWTCDAVRQVCTQTPTNNLDAMGDAIAVATDGSAAERCVGLASTCGPTGTSACCTSPLVPGSTFDRSYDVGTDGMYPNTSNPATVSDFRLDTYEITVGRFRQFVAAGAGTQQVPPTPGSGAHALIPNSGWQASWNANLTADSPSLITALSCDAQHQSWTNAAGANESLPMNCITWFEAAAFCAWDEGFLPTDAEWNYAAVGGTEQRAYPWSSPASSLTVDCSHANYNNGTTTCVIGPPAGGVNRVGSESPTGDGKWGQADLAGNVYEWTLDWSGSPYILPCDNCADLTPGTVRGARGGYFNAAAQYLRPNFRGSDGPGDRSPDFGARCGRAP